MPTLTQSNYLKEDQLVRQKNCKESKVTPSDGKKIPGPVFTKILRIFLRITLKSKKNSLLRIFLFLE